jgi:molybdopterin-synthase adenylyltransferase
MTVRKCTRREYLEVFTAQQNVLTRTQQLRLSRSTVHVAGLGGVGFHVAMFLSELGVGSISTNDPQTIEIDNLNRIPFASVEHLGIPKVCLLWRMLRCRPHRRIQLLQRPSEDPAAEKLHREADLIICCSNTYASRFQSTRVAIRRRIPLIDVGVCDARRGAIAGLRVFDPSDHSGACPICTSTSRPRTNHDQRLLGPVVGAAAATAAHIALGLLLHRRRAESPRNLIELNLGTLQIQSMHVLRNPQCKACATQAAG